MLYLGVAESKQLPCRVDASVKRARTGPTILQRKCDCGGAPDCDCQSRQKDSGTPGPLHRSAVDTAGPVHAPPSVDRVVRSPGRALDPETRAFFEDRFAGDLSGVRVHTDAAAAESARTVNSLAYTVGQHVVFGANRYQPETDTGRRLLAHELAHTRQQGVSGIPLPEELRVTDPSEAGEHEAERAAHVAMQFGGRLGAGNGRAGCRGGATVVARQADPPQQALPSTAPQATPTSSTSSGSTTAAVDCSALRGRRIAAFGGSAGPWKLNELTKNIVQALQACDLAYVGIYVVPKAGGDDPRGAAVQRAENVKNALMQWIGPGRFAEDRFYTGLSTSSSNGAEVEVYLESRGRVISAGTGGVTTAGKTSTESATPTKSTRAESEQVSAQVGVGYVGHRYTTPSGPGDPLHEWLNQFVGAYNIVHHGKDESGTELQISVTVQYSLTTHQETVLVGGQVLYVRPLPWDFQLGLWAQLQGGRNVSAASNQEQLAAGAQLNWQPKDKDWLSIGAQIGAGPTVQSSGPNSVDINAMFVFQIQK